MSARRTGKLTRSQLMRRLARVELLALDVDGVLTDGGVYYAEDGRQLRKFDVKDGVGMQSVQAAGIQLAIVTASKAPAIRHRAKVLGVDHVFIGVGDKLRTVTALCGDLGIGLDQVAYAGDDVNDAGVLGAVGAPMTVADAATQAKAAAAYVTERNGGAGAVREICELLIAARTVPRPKRATSRKR
ncbi:MAG: HAD hydrolase family protein [Rhodospirillales bacterium]|jgi:3-deoxy-D-manno-octulosonate 8-phosphate phosphatase (KDO 8-P phosphatase)|nr:HAD hydrolase family protein [Rhodospirillales bacterium]MDP6804193.1 HAD hydrolase family protein [Rhodospirillales bacterium]